MIRLLKSIVRKFSRQKYDGVELFFAELKPDIHYLIFVGKDQLSLQEAARVGWKSSFDFDGTPIPGGRPYVKVVRLNSLDADRPPQVYEFVTEQLTKQ